MSVPAARIRTSSAWRDMAIQGAPGPPGSTPSARAYAQFTYSGADNAHRIYTPATTRHWDEIGCLPAAGAALVLTIPKTGRYQLTVKIVQIQNPGTINVSGIVNDSVPTNGTSATISAKGDGTETGGVENVNLLDLVAGNTIKVFTSHSGGGTAYVIFELIQLAGLPGNPNPGYPPYLTAAQFASIIPIDGQEVYLIADATNGVIWHLRYNAASASAYKWEYLGGAPLYHDTGTDDASFSGTTYVDLSGGTPGPQLTTPLAGDYILEFGALSYQTVVNITNYLSPKIGAAATSDNDASAIAFAGTSQLATHQRKKRFNAIAASTLIKLQGRSSSANAGAARSRWMTLQPVRVG